MWVVYFAICSDGSIYTGITTDLKRREHEHNHTSKGAKFTKSRRPVKLHQVFACESRSQALKIEISLKRMCKKNKLKLLFDKN
jgi:putative endonuclease